MNEAELLFTHVLGCDRLSLYMDKDKLLDEDQAATICNVLKKRAQGEPIQYILGRGDFFGLEFKVNKNVLIPRPETEILVETVLRYAKGDSILDLGTGSGCIAVALAKSLKNIKVDAADISSAALNTARTNANLNCVDINFIESDLFNNLVNTYDLIVSNPPYISSAEIKKLAPEVQCEPKIALDGGREGLDFYSRIIRDSLKYLKDSGYLIFEIGFGQLDRIKEFILDSGKFKILEIIKDYNSIDRVIVLRKVD